MMNFSMSIRAMSLTKYWSDNDQIKFWVFHVSRDFPAIDWTNQNLTSSWTNTNNLINMQHKYTIEYLQKRSIEKAQLTNQSTPRDPTATTRNGKPTSFAGRSSEVEEKELGPGTTTWSPNRPPFPRRYCHRPTVSTEPTRNRRRG